MGRVNLEPNPRLQTNDAWWILRKSTEFVDNGSGRGIIGTTPCWRIRGTKDANSSVREIGCITPTPVTTFAAPVTAGLPYSFSCLMFAFDGDAGEPGDDGLRLELLWYNAAGTFISSNASTPEGIIEGVPGLRRYGFTATAPPTAAFLRRSCTVITDVASDVIDVAVTEFLTEQSATVGDYFDGRTAGYMFQGAADASITVENLPLRVLRDFTPPPYRLRVLLGDEDVTDHIEGDVTYSNVDQGGHEVSAFTFPKTVVVPKATPIRIEGGMGTLWKGRTAEGGDGFQRQANRTQVSGEGMGGVFKENEVQEIFIDTDLGHWRDPGTQQRINMIAASFTPSGPSTLTDLTTGAPSLLLAFTGAWAANALPTCQAFYDSEGPSIGELYYAWKRGQHADYTNALFDLFAGLQDGDTGFLLDSTGDMMAAGPVQGVLNASTTTRKVARLDFRYSAAGGGDNQAYEMYMTALGVRGTHGLPERSAAGDDPYTVVPGLYPSDIISYLVRLAPGISEGTIVTSDDFIIRQSEYRKPVLLEQALADVASFERWAWGTWESPSMLNDSDVFDFHPYPSEPNCWTTLDRCEGLDLTSRLNELYNRAIVSWQDTSGRPHTTIVTRAIPDLEEEGLTRTMLVDFGLGTDITAESFGNFALALQERVARASGSFTARGNVRTAVGEKPAHALRSGKDAIRINDVPDKYALGHPDFQIRRVGVTANKQGASAQIEIGAGADLLPVLQARLANAVKAG